MSCAWSIAMAARAAAAAGLLNGLIVGLCGFVISANIHKADSATHWLTPLLAEPGLISGVGVVFLFDAIAAGRYAAALRANIKLEKPDLMLTLMRVVFLMLPAALLAKLNVTTAFAGWSMLIAMVLSILLFEGLPTVAKRVITRPRSANP